MRAQNITGYRVREFPALNRLTRLYVGMAVVGGALIGLGLLIAVFWQAWPLAVPPLAGGSIGLAGGLWGRHRALQLITRLRAGRST